MNTHYRNIAVVGGGAIGGLIAARLARAGATVGVLARGAQLDAIRRNGLTVIDGDTRETVALEATDRASELGVQDLLIVCLKGQALTAAAASLAPLVGPRTHIVSAMNGVPWWFLHDFGGRHANGRLESVDPGGVVSSALPPAQAFGCVVHLSSSIAAPGVARKGNGNRLIVGSASAGETAHAQAIAAMLAQADFDATPSDQIRADIWMKLWGNMTINPISALTRSTADVILDDPLSAALVRSVMEEARAVGRQFGLDTTMTFEERNAITRKLGAFRTSMLQDVEAGRSLEVEALLGAPYELAQRTGVDAPSLGMLYGLARQLDANLEAARRRAAHA
ncbi:2-dehydropantoate 2-reductase [Burkholderia sp. WAC0059]|uniref:2-dehydropantoate 2-reductase n=1 Tax=Burkholderia sp. WAC0059 TaxID=2066022 RepID=UPI000C7E97CB|nr:2-dehydropantoate 2-reductase [Burkholderia sp. WAC0059]PLZ00923.1 2-dehydropantoate 2-reductase [Burkholderia sp. WAC0059]